MNLERFLNDIDIPTRTKIIYITTLVCVQIS
jgi:hypothetical protein